MDGGETAIGRKHRISVGWRRGRGALRVSVAMGAVRDAGVTRGHTVGKTERAYDQIIDRLWAETAQGEECPCSTRGGGAAKRFKIELARGDQARGFDEAVRLLVRAREW